MCILIKEVSDAFVKSSMFSIPSGKAPGPDGYNSEFYKAALEVVGDSVSKVVRDFFRSGNLIVKIIATTTLIMEPKVQLSRPVTEYRPIACCNTPYNCINKMLCARLKTVLPYIVSPIQAGFIYVREIIIVFV